MATTRVRGIFSDPGAASRAATALRERGMREVDVWSEPIAQASPQPQPRRGKPATAFMISLIIGAAVGLTLGLIIGLPSLALPSVRDSVSAIILTVVGSALGGAIVGAIGGAIVGGLFGPEYARPAAAPEPPAPALAQAERVVVAVPVADERAEGEARRLLHGLNAQAVEAAE